MGSGGGGSASGAIDYPEYMKIWHETGLGVGTKVTKTVVTTDENGIQTETVTTSHTGEVINVSLTEAMNYAMDGASPYVGAILPDADYLLVGQEDIGYAKRPFTYLSEYAALDLATLISDFRNNSILDTFVANRDNRIAELIAADSALLDEDINTVTLPQFKAGMRDIGMCLSSAIAIGEANIWASKERTLGKNAAAYRFEMEKAYAQLAQTSDDYAARLAINYVEIKKGMVSISADMMKLYATMAAELEDFNAENIAKDKLWDVKVYQYGGNFLGSIAGSAVNTDKGDGKPSRLQSTATTAVGGAAAGAYIGAQIGSGYPGIGTAIGGVVGALYGWLSS